MDGSNICAIKPTCRMFRVWEEGQRVLLEVFSHTTLREIVDEQLAGARHAMSPLGSTAAELAKPLA